MATCTGEIDDSPKCAPTAVTTLCKLSSILSWHSTLMAQGRLTVMQDLAGCGPSAKARASAALQAPHE